MSIQLVVAYCSFVFVFETHVLCWVQSVFVALAAGPGLQSRAASCALAFALSIAAPQQWRHATLPLGSTAPCETQLRAAACLCNVISAHEAQGVDAVGEALRRVVAGELHTGQQEQQTEIAEDKEETAMATASRPRKEAQRANAKEVPAH